MGKKPNRENDKKTTIEKIKTKSKTKLNKIKYS